MFDNHRYLTRGVNESIPFETQAFIWNCIDRLPEYKMNYFIPMFKAVTAKVYVIDSVEYSTMLLAEEY